MNEEKYNYFIKICELGSITKAAESLYISQPALSKYLNRIESDLEVKLIEREFSPVKLTDAGEIYLKYSKEMLKRYNQMRDDISGYIDSAGKRLSVTGETIGIDSDGTGKINRTVHMILLCHNGGAVHLKNMSGAVHGIIGIQSGMVHEYGIVRNTGLFQIRFHNIDFIVIGFIMITADDNFVRHMIFVQDNRLIQPFLKHRAGLIVLIYPCSQNQDTVFGTGIGWFLFGINIGRGTLPHPKIRPCHETSA